MMTEISIDKSLTSDGAQSNRRGGPLRRVQFLQPFITSLRLSLPVLLWIVFVNVAHRYHTVPEAADAALGQAVAADLAARRCPALRLDVEAFRQFAHDNGINHADLYQKQSLHLQKIIARLEALLRAKPEFMCRSLLEQYGTPGRRLLRAL